MIFKTHNTVYPIFAPFYLKTLELLLTLSKPLLSLPLPFEWFGSLHRWENGMETSLTTKSFTCRAQFPVRGRKKKPLWCGLRILMRRNLSLMSLRNGLNTEFGCWRAPLWAMGPHLTPFWSVLGKMVGLLYFCKQVI